MQLFKRIYKYKSNFMISAGDMFWRPRVKKNSDDHFLCAPPPSPPTEKNLIYASNYVGIF